MLLADGVSQGKAKRMHWAVERFGEGRFIRPGFVARTTDEPDELDQHDCDCAQDAVEQILAEEDPSERDPELLESLAQLDWHVIRSLLKR